MLVKLSVIAILAALTVPAVASAEEIRISGGGAAISSIFMPMKNGFENATGDRLTITMSTPVKGLQDLLAGKVDIATCAYPIDELLDMAVASKVAIDPTGLWSLILSKSQTVVLVHKSNPVQRLTKQQLKDIFSGRTTNWRKLGGLDLPIEVIWGSSTVGQNARFQHVILDDESITAKSKAATDYASISQVVGTSPGGIGIDPIGFKTPDVAAPEVPAVFSPIIIITKGVPSPKVQKVVDYYLRETPL